MRVPLCECEFDLVVVACDLRDTVRGPSSRKVRISKRCAGPLGILKALACKRHTSVTERNPTVGNRTQEFLVFVLHKFASFAKMLDLCKMMGLEE